MTPLLLTSPYWKRVVLELCKLVLLCTQYQFLCGVLQLIISLIFNIPQNEVFQYSNLNIIFTFSNLDILFKLLYWFV